MRIKRAGKIIMTLGLTLFLVLATACTPSEAEVLKGVLENVDSVNGTITVVTNDGKTVTIKIATETQVETEGNDSTIESLEPGASVEVEVKEKTQVAQHIRELAPSPTIGWGILEIRVTDPPPADVKSAVVHLTNIEVHKVSGNESGWIPVLGAPSSFDLMDVIGVEQVLGSANLTAGSFTQIRMDVTSVSGNTTADVPYTAEVSGGKLKIVRPFNVGGGKVTTLTLDFDGEQSLKLTPNGKAIFTPVVKLLISEKIKAEQEQEQEQEHERTKFEGTIKAITSDNWTVTIGSDNWTVNVSGAEIEGEPAVGLKVEIKGTIVENTSTIIASKVEIKRARD